MSKGREFIGDMVYAMRFHCPPTHSQMAVRQAYLAGREYGRGEGVQAVVEGLGKQGVQVHILETNVPDTTVLYTSLDSSVVIKDAAELVQSVLGKIPRSDQEAYELRSALVTKIGMILGHSEKRTLTSVEIEFLRKVKALLQALDFTPDQLCQNGQILIERVDKILSNYEEKRD